jgi:Peptidase family M23
MRRLAVAALCALVLPVSAAQAWTWPVDGPVVRPFSFDRAHPYAGGQHRGIDLGAPTGTSVRAPSDGVVSFAGTVPTGGKTLSIQTPAGYTATLVHLGSIGVKRGARVTEGTVVGTVGPSGVADLPEPYVYFGLRTTTDDQGYVDPLAFLPPRAAAEAARTVDVPVSGAVAEVPAASAVAASPSTPAVEVPVATQAPAATAVPDVGATSQQAAAESTESGSPAARESLTVETVQRPVRSAGVIGSEAPIATAKPVGSVVTHDTRVMPRAHAEAKAQRPPAPIARRASWHSSPAQQDVDVSGTAHARHGWSWLVTLIGVVAAAFLVAPGVHIGRRRRARIMGAVEREQSFVEADAEAEGVGGPSLAVRVGQASPGPRRRVRGASGHLRAVPPLAWERRLDGEWHGRARDTRDGHGRSRGRLAA